MKLKWKIFLVSLLFIMIAVSITALTVLHITFSSTIEKEKQSAAAYHSYFSASLSNRLTYEELQSGVAVLEDTDVKKIVSSSAADFSSFGSAEAVLVIKDETVLGSGGKVFDIDRSKLPAPEEMLEDKYYICIYDTNGSTILTTASLVNNKSSSFVCYTAHDITATYVSYKNLSGMAGTASIAFALLVSVILFGFTAFLLRHISRLNNSIRSISEGNYSARATVEGSKELREIAENINIMAEAVEGNVERLEDIADGRKRYVDSLAHEMKTPLTSILCYADLLRIKRDVTEEERLEYSSVIVDEARRLKSLSSKLLELATADNAELDFEMISVAAILKEVETTLMPALAIRGISLSISIEDGLIYADRELFKSLIYNLADNAAKASEKGQSIMIISRAAENGMIITVADRGIGMTKDVLRKITEPFYMADKSRSRKAGGAGLGLSLCVEIARRHNAKIKIKSRPGRGTSVFITIPYAKKGESK